MFYFIAVIINDDTELQSLSDGNASSMIHGRSMDSIQSTFTNGSSSPQHLGLEPTCLEADSNLDEQEEKARLISQVLELQNTLDGRYITFQITLICFLFKFLYFRSFSKSRQCKRRKFKIKI